MLWIIFVECGRTKKRNIVKIYILEYSVPVNLNTYSNTQQELYYVYVHYDNIKV